MSSYTCPIFYFSCWFCQNVCQSPSKKLHNEHNILWCDEIECCSFMRLFFFLNFVFPYVQLFETRTEAPGLWKFLLQREMWGLEGALKYFNLNHYRPRKIPITTRGSSWMELYKKLEYNKNLEYVGSGDKKKKANLMRYSYSKRFFQN